jgi:hypothetical protein
MGRQYRCIALTLPELLAVRELIRPFTSTGNVLEPSSVINFCKKLYRACIKMKTNGLEEINIKLDDDECLIINNFIGMEDFEGSIEILYQTWSVLYELINDVPPQYDSMSQEMLELIREGEENA